MQENEPYTKVTLSQIAEKLDKFMSNVDDFKDVVRNDVKNLELKIKDQNNIKEDIERLTNVVKDINDRCHKNLYEPDGNIFRLREKVKELDDFIQKDTGRREGMSAVEKGFRNWLLVIIAIAGIIVGRFVF